MQAPGQASTENKMQAPGRTHPQRAHQRTWQDGPVRQRASPTDGDESEPSNFTAARVWGQPPAAVANLGHSVPSEYHLSTRLTKAFIASQPILQDVWEDVDDDDLGW